MSIRNTNTSLTTLFTAVRTTFTAALARWLASPKDVAIRELATLTDADGDKFKIIVTFQPATENGQVVEEVAIRIRRRLR